LMSETSGEKSDHIQHSQVPDELVDQLLGRANAEGSDLLGPDGLLSVVTKQVLDRALDTELTEHLGYDKNDPAGRGSGNSRNGTSPKTVPTDIGPVEVAVPQVRAGVCQPAAALPPAAWGQVASRRGVRHRWSAAVPVAGRRSARHRPGHSGAVPP